MCKEAVFCSFPANQCLDSGRRQKACNQNPHPATITTPDELSTSQAQAGQRDTAPGAEPEPAAVAGAGAGESAEGGRSADAGGVSTKNAYTEAQRAERGFPGAVKEARRDFGKVWEEVEETYRRDPGAGAGLVEEINASRCFRLSRARADVNVATKLNCFKISELLPHAFGPLNRKKRISATARGL
jgi:hypothetical protein